MARVGRQTPTQAVVLPFDDTHGLEAIEAYESSGRVAMEWQKLLISDVMGINKDGLWTHSTFCYEVPRQNGKGEVLTMREFWGLLNGERIIHTAHRTPTSHSAFVRLSEILTSAGYVELWRKKKDEEPPEKSFKSTKQFGLEQIMLTNGGSIVFRTRSEAGGLGESFDLLIIDEAQEYTVTQQGALMYTIAASPNPQTILCGTPPTLVSKGTIFVGLRNKVLSGQSHDIGWAEWSTYENPKDILDEDVLYETNPSLGLRLQLRTIRNENTTDRLDFIIQRLGYWHTYNLKSEITEKDWMHLKVTKKPDFMGKLSVGIKFGADNLNTSMSIAVKTRDGKIFVETIDCQSQMKGFDWMLRFIKTGCISTVVIDGKGKSELLNDAIAEMTTEFKPKVVMPSTTEAITAYSAFRQSIDTETISHNGQPSVTQSISNCEKRMIGTNGAFGFRSLKEGIDVSIVESIALAYWACSTQKERRKQRVWY